MDRVLDLKPRVVGLNSGRKSMTAPWALHSLLPTAPGVCALGWVKCREMQIALYNCVCEK